MKEILKIDKLDVGYVSKVKRNILINDINLSVGQGETIAILGLNGSGKSSFLKTIRGELEPVKGDVLIANDSIKNMTPKALSIHVSSVGTSFENPGQLSVEELIGFGRYPFTGRMNYLNEEDRSHIENAIHIVGLEGLRNSMIDELSDGERQKVMLACAFAQNTPMLILDEPTSHLDVRNKVAVMKLIQQIVIKENKTVLFTTHDIALARNIASRIWIIHDTRLVDETVDDFIKNRSWKPLFDGIEEEFTNFL
jgi:iron complex transport system ATP-binding protein